MKNRRSKTVASIITAGLLTAVTGCTGASGESTIDETAPTQPAPYATSIANSEAGMIAAARSQLANRLGLATDTSDAITTEAFARVVWPNGAVGCPKPGRSYTMALVPGYQVILRVGDRLYHYHGREGQAPFFCARPEGQGDWQMDR